VRVEVATAYRTESKPPTGTEKQNATLNRKADTPPGLTGKYSSKSVHSAIGKSTLTTCNAASSVK